MTVRRASCSCGQLVATVAGEPASVSVCHCLACQRRTGSVFGAQARFQADQVAVSGEASNYLRVGDEGAHARFSFCPRCGATVVYTVDEMPGAVMLPVGAFADPAFPPPVASVYEERMHRWVGLPGGMRHLA